MIKRREIEIKLADGKKYIFSERNKNDMDFAALQEKVRKAQVNFIQDNIKNGDNQLALLMAEMNKVYSDEQVNLFIYSCPDEIKNILFDSFKIKNDLPIEKFKELIPDEKAREFSDLLLALESDGTPAKGSKKKTPTAR